MGCGKSETAGGSAGHCVSDVLRAIKDIQDAGAVEECEGCTTSCFLEPLGGIVSPGRSNPADTRVFMLLTKNGDPFKAFFRDKDCPDTDCYSVFFRVEEVFGNNCATIRVLEPLSIKREAVNLIDATCTTINLKKVCSVRQYGKTESCLTVDLSCFCGVQCIDDVFLDIC